MTGKKNKPEDVGVGVTSLGYHPFSRLKGLVTPPKTVSVGQPPEIKAMSPQSLPTDQQIFLEAMQGVRPMEREAAAKEQVLAKWPSVEKFSLENEALSRLDRLIRRGEGFVVSDTPEYMEGTGYQAREEFARRLHRGDFSISGHIDLHGMNVETARQSFEAFMKASYLAGRGAVLIIHGRGLSSPGEAVLKNKVRQWLSSSYWRKRVLAFASAQAYDGGAGATYVLLRDRPVSKRASKGKGGSWRSTSG